MKELENITRKTNFIPHVKRFKKNQREYYFNNMLEKLKLDLYEQLDKSIWLIPSVTCPKADK